MAPVNRILDCIGELRKERMAAGTCARDIYLHHLPAETQLNLHKYKGSIIQATLQVKNIKQLSCKSYSHLTFISDTLAI